jgi:nucleoside-diphosphate-sugar epimerase
VVESIDLDATDASALSRALVGIDSAVNCVGGTPAVMVASAGALAAAAAAHHPRPRVIHLSSMSVYGSATGMVDEGAALHANAGAYAKGKVEAERLSAAYSNLVVLRPGCIYGPGSGQWSLRIAALLLSGRIGDLGPRGEGYCNLVLADDVAGAVLQALKLDDVAGQAFNLAATSQLTWNQYFRLFAKVLGTLPLRQISPIQLLADTMLLAPMLKVADAFSGGSATRRLRLPPFSPSLLRLFGLRLELNARKAEEMLAMSWTPLNDGLIATVSRPWALERS